MRSTKCKATWQNYPDSCQNKEKHPAFLQGVMALQGNFDTIAVRVQNGCIRVQFVHFVHFSHDLVRHLRMTVYVNNSLIVSRIGALERP